MDDPNVLSATLVSRWRGNEAARYLALARGGDPVRPWFPGPRELDAFQEVCGELDPDTATATGAHLARAAAESSLLDVRARLAAIWRSPVRLARETMTVSDAARALWAGTTRDSPLRVLDQAHHQVVDVVTRSRAQGDRAAGDLLRRLAVGRHPDAGPDPADRLATAKHVLDATQDVAGGVRDFLGAESLEQLLGALRLREHDGEVPARRRYRRLGAMWGELENELARCVRVDDAHQAPALEGRVLILQPCRDIRIQPSSWEQGWQSERAAAANVGRALALVMISPALPESLKRPTAQTVARAFGHLATQIWSDERRVKKDHGKGVAAQRMQLCGARRILELRWSAAAVCARALRPRDTSQWDDRGEDLGVACAELAKEALGVAVPDALARLTLHTPSGSGARLRAQLGALRVWVALRDAHDEDWYRNPRSAERLREIAAQGGSTSVEAWCDDLGVPEDAAFARLAELFR